MTGESHNRRVGRDNSPPTPPLQDRPLRVYFASRYFAVIPAMGPM